MPLTAQERELLTRHIQSQHLKIKTSLGWKNFSQNLNVPEALVLDVKDIPSLQSLVKEIDRLNHLKNPEERILVRALAGGLHDTHSESYSFTEGSLGDVVIRLTGPVFKEISKTNNEKVMHVGASVQIGELEEKLYHQYNLSLPTSSLISYVTVAGLAANAGHGTGKDQPSFAGLIRAMTLLLPNGEIVKIDASHPDFATIRAAHLGLFGIVLNLEIECMEAKKVECVMDVTTLPELIAAIKKGLYDNDLYVSVMYVPTYQASEINSKQITNVIIYRWRPVDKNTPDTVSFPEFDKFIQQLQMKLHHAFKINDLLRWIPSLIPSYMIYLVTRVGIGSKDSTFVGPWPLTHYQYSFPWDINDVDFLFEVSANKTEMIKGLEYFVAQLTQFAKQKIYPIVNAVYLRLFQGTNGGLSSSAHAEHKKVCGFDIVSSPDIPGYDLFRDVCIKYFVNELSAKLHWGKYAPNTLNYETMYGAEYTHFKEVLSQWYVDHGMNLENSMLLNSFFCEVLKLPYAPAVEKIADEKMAASPYAAMTVSDMALELCKCICEDDIYAKNFREKLRGVAYPSVAAGHQSLFATQSARHPNSSSGIQKEDVTPVTRHP